VSLSRYPEYKNSKIKWLGDIPSHWSIAPLKRTASCNDTVLSEKTPKDALIEYVEISDVNSVLGITGSTTYPFSEAPSRARRLVQDQDVLVSTVRTYLKAITPVLNPPSNMVASTGFAVIRPDSRHLAGGFLGYLLRSEWIVSKIIARSVGVSYPAVNASDIMQLNVPVPKKQEQLIISGFLDHESAKIDTLIHEQKRLIELLKEKRQAVISHAVTKGLDPDVPMQYSGVEWLGEVPTHWKVTRGKMVADIFVPQRNKPELNDSGDGYCWVTMEDMKTDQIVTSKRYVSNAAIASAGSRVLKRGAVVASCVGNFGIASVLSTDAVINQQLQAYIPRGVSAAYLREVIRCSKRYFDLVGTAATLAYVNQEGFANLPIPLPSIAEQGEIELYIEKNKVKFNGAIFEGIKLIDILKERRSALISAAVTGKIDVRNWHQPADESAFDEEVQQAGMETTA